MNRLVYVDNAATTKIADNVLDAMLPFLKENFGNASSIYSVGRESKKAIENARKRVANAIGALPQEIYFTSGGTESDNWAIRGAAHRQAEKGKNHIITTNFEHHAVLHTCEYLEKRGFEVTYLPINEDGFITVQQVKDAIKENTGLVTVMYANNEIGTIQPIDEIGNLCRENKILFHTDAVQAIGNVHIDLSKQNIDLLSLSSHKINGPKGVGVLYMRKGVVIDSIITGGGQERSKRSGTENVANIVGLGVAIKDAVDNIDKKVEKLTKLRNRLIDGVLKISKTRINGSLNNRLCNNINFSFGAIEGESLLLMLDMNGICGSSGSACTSGSLDPSHVLIALGLSHETAHGSLRISLSYDNTEEEIDYIIEKLPPIVKRLREISPLWEEN